MADREKIIHVKRNCPFCGSTQIRYYETHAMDGFPSRYIQCCECGITDYVENEASGMIFWHYGLDAYKKYLDMKSKEEIENEESRKRTF